MVARKTLCLRRLGGDRAGELRVGRFFANPKVTTAKIIDSWGTQTGTAAAGRHVLAIQDTSEVIWPTSPQRRRGLGLVGKGNAYGVLVHAMLAADAGTGACLGLVGGAVWNRPGKVTTTIYERALEDRESIRWQRTAEQAKHILAPAARVTVVADREADIYAQWATVPDSGFDLLSRASNDRRLADGGMLFAAADRFALADTRTIKVASHAPGQPRRWAEMALRFGEVEIARPRDPHHHPFAPTVRLRVIDVREIAPPRGSEPLHWRLLTTHTITDAAQAWQAVGWYQARWIIEQLFRVMKSQGLDLENSQMTSAERLVKLAATAVKAACIDMQLVQERDGKHGSDATAVFTGSEIDTLGALNPTLAGSTPRQRNPHPPSSLAWAAWIIARLGGWNCYYKPPGPITMRRGMEQFYAIHRGRTLEMKPQQDVRIP
jgi:Transposase DDE domain